MELFCASAYSDFMENAEQFRVRIELDPLIVGRFRWTVCEGVQIHLRSPHSYATRIEAEREAECARQKFTEKWSASR
jgi:hypothetical protein